MENLEKRIKFVCGNETLSDSTSARAFAENRLKFICGDDDLRNVESLQTSARLKFCQGDDDLKFLSHAELQNFENHRLKFVQGDDDLKNGTGFDATAQDFRPHRLVLRPVKQQQPQPQRNSTRGLFNLWRR